MAGDILRAGVVVALIFLAVIMHAVWTTTLRERRDIAEYRRVLRMQGFSDYHIERRIQFVQHLPRRRRLRWMYGKYWRRR